MPRILVIDDDDAVRETMARTLRGAGYTVETAETGEQGVSAARGNGFDVILSDLRMPGISGIEVLQRLRDLRVDSGFIVMTMKPESTRRSRSRCNTSIPEMPGIRRSERMTSKPLPRAAETPCSPVSAVSTV